MQKHRSSPLLMTSLLALCLSAWLCLGFAEHPLYQADHASTGYVQSSQADAGHLVALIPAKKLSYRLGLMQSSHAHAHLPKQHLTKGLGLNTMVSAKQPSFLDWLMQSEVAPLTLDAWQSFAIMPMYGPDGATLALKVWF